MEHNESLTQPKIVKFAVVLGDKGDSFTYYHQYEDGRVMRGQSRRLEDGSWNGFFSTEVDLTKEKHLDELPWQDTTPKLGVEEEVT